MKSHQITILGPMLGKQRAGSNGTRRYTPDQTRGKETEIGWLAKATGCTPITGACHLHVAITIEPPASWSRAKRAEAHNGRVLPTSKPDLDNCVKLIADALNGIAWLDDSQLIQVIATKIYGPVAQTIIGWAEA